MFMLHLNPSRHVLPPGPLEIERFLGRTFPGEPLFVYFHRHTGKWLIARWISKPQGLAFEMMTLGPVPIFQNPVQVYDLRARLFDPQSRHDLKAHTAAIEYRQRMTQIQDAAELQELQDKTVRDLHPGIGDHARHIFLPGDP